MHTPSWFSNEDVLVSFAPTCGINKDGDELYLVDETTGRRTVVLNNRLKEDVDAVLAGQQTETIRWVRRSDVTKLGVVVPVYFDTRPAKRYFRAVQTHWPRSESKTLGRLIQEELVTVRYGHGSPSADVRTDMVPYIKVSDLRAGQLNINPTNRVSRVVARKQWKGETSGLKPYDLLTPTRTSKNIGDIAILMPGQEQVVLTKEILVIRPGPRAHFDSFYLMWALMLSCVREQWSRVIFMQTNREDVDRSPS